MVRRVYPLSGDISFHIPSSYVLEAGRTLTVGRTHTHTHTRVPLLNNKVSIVPQIWAAAAEAEADPGDLILQSHRSWGPITDVRVSLLNPNREVMVPQAFRPRLV